MNKNEKFVITINRELGSGGRTVGRLLADKLGVPFYDKAVIKTLQEKYHISPEEIERLKGRKHSWWADVERMARKQGIAPEEARKIIDQVDKMRENYVKKYTGTSRYDTRNYQLVIAADGKTEEQMADLIMQYIED